MFILRAQELRLWPVSGPGHGLAVVEEVRVARLERDLKDFVTEHRADMGKVKTKALTFGEVSFRLSTAISLPRAKDKIEPTT